MKHTVIVITVVALAIGGGAACSSERPSAKPKRGTLHAGMAELTIDGKTVPTTGTVQCAPEEYLTTIRTGGDASWATVMVSNADKLTVEFVRIHNLNGFTGDYNRGLEGHAIVAMIDDTYDITGAALGFGPKSPEPTTEPFTIKVSC